MTSIRIPDGMTFDQWQKSSQGRAAADWQRMFMNRQNNRTAAPKRDLVIPAPQAGNSGEGPLSALASQSTQGGPAQPSPARGSVASGGANLNWSSPAPAPIPPAPPRPQFARQSSLDEHDLMEFLFRQLREQYPSIDEREILDAARRLANEMRQKQKEDFYQRFFPERIAAKPLPPEPVRQVWTASPPAKPGAAQPIQPPADGTPLGAPSAQQSAGLPDPRQFNGMPLENLTDEEIAALNANEQAKGPSVQKRYYRTDDGKAAIAR